MINKQPLLSICIPSYNRCEYLDKTIHSIVSDPLFTNGKVELIISDNCSSDDTQKVVAGYRKKFDNIIYHRNEHNIKDANYNMALSLGKGTFLKLYTDTAVFEKETLSFLLDVVQKNAEEKPVLCFPNDSLPHISIEKKECTSFNEFVDIVSFQSTWIATFGIWKEDFDSLTDICRSVDLQLWQTDVLLRLVAQKQRAVVYNKKLIEIQVISPKGGYNPFKVFGDNYLSLYKEYIDTGQLSKRTFRKEKKRLFRYFFLSWTRVLCIEKPDIYTFELDKGFRILFKHYKTYLIFYAGCIYWCYYRIKVWVHRFMRGSK